MLARFWFVCVISLFERYVISYVNDRAFAVTRLYKRSSAVQQQCLACDNSFIIHRSLFFVHTMCHPFQISLPLAILSRHTIDIKATFSPSCCRCRGAVYRRENQQSRNKKNSIRDIKIFGCLFSFFPLIDALLLFGASLSWERLPIRQLE